MTVFLTVLLAYLAEKRRGYWIVKPFNNIARYVERMLSPGIQASASASVAA